MVDPRWLHLLPLVVAQSDFQAGAQAGARHWWDEWHGQASQEEISAFLAVDWSYAYVMRRNQEAQELGVPGVTEAFAVGFVFGWVAAVYGE